MTGLRHAGDRYVVVGLARVRAPWFAEVAGWANSAQLPLDFLKCVSANEVRERLGGDRPVSAVLAADDAIGLDRDLIDTARAHGAAVLVLGDPGRWADLGAAAVLPPPLAADDLRAALDAHARPVRTVLAGAPTAEPAAPVQRFRGRLVTVVGGPGSGTSTVAIALAQGFGAEPANQGAVALADLARPGDLALYHDTGDVVPGLPELVEAHRSTTPSVTAVRRHLYDVAERGYSVLLGLRRTREASSLRPRAVEAAVESLRAAYRVVVADADHELDGERETGSRDVEDRNAAARFAVGTADLVVVCGTPTLTGIQSIARIERDLTGLGVDRGRVLRVVNRAPRSPRGRSECAAALAAVAPDGGPTVFVPDRRQVEVAHRTSSPLPAAIVAPMTRAAAALTP